MIIFIEEEEEEEEELLTLNRYIDTDLRLSRKERISLLSMTRRERERRISNVHHLSCFQQRYEKKTKIEKKTSSQSATIDFQRFFLLSLFDACQRTEMKTNLGSDC